MDGAERSRLITFVVAYACARKFVTAVVRVSLQRGVKETEMYLQNMLRCRTRTSRTEVFSTLCEPVLPEVVSVIECRGSRLSLCLSWVLAFFGRLRGMFLMCAGISGRTLPFALQLAFRF